MADGRFDAHLERDTRDEEGRDAAVAQGDVEVGAGEGGHRDFVHDRLAAPGRQLGHDPGLRRVPRERCDDLIDVVEALPVHRGAQLRDTGDLHREGDVPGEEDSQSGPSGQVEHLCDAGDDVRPVGKLADDADLHVIDDQREGLAGRRFAERAGDGQAVDVLHEVFRFRLGLTERARPGIRVLSNPRRGRCRVLERSGGPYGTLS